MPQYPITMRQHVKMNAPKNELAWSAFIVIIEQKRKSPIKNGPHRRDFFHGSF